ISTIVCADDPARAWTEHSLRGRRMPPKPAGCDRGMLARNLQLGRSFGIQGTPTMIFASGEMHSGALPAPTLERLLAQP
ncbi:MAG: thioredoxin fold domain-containing protein, partial [Duodenibacillus sp.]|nr:thioredoxin fold domain-containing protein [Duodenibacillus sp.]